MKTVDESKTQTINEELEGRFKEERADWNDKMYDVIKSIKDTKNLTEAQVVQLSFRQMVSEKICEYRILRDKREESYDKLISKRSFEYDNASAIKLSSTEKKVHLSADYASLNRQIKLINCQITYFEEMIKTLDNIGFAIKNHLFIINNQLI